MAFVDRLVEYPNRVLLEDTHGTQTGPYTMIRDEGTVTEEGTPLNAANLNSEIQSAVDDATQAFEVDNSLNVHIRNLQAGVSSGNVAANTNVKRHITFATPFTNPPYVLATLKENAPNTGWVTVHNVTTTGFDLWIRRTGAYTTVVYWLAIL